MSLVGGSPLRSLRLTPIAAEYVVDRQVWVGDTVTDHIARRLLDGNLADPENLAPVDPAELTVVVPAHDRPAHLDRCLGALGGLRVIVVDDASHDPGAVAEVVRRRGATLIALTDNRGPAGARNAGLARVGTAYVAFVDSDVMAAPLMLTRLAAKLADPRVALAGPRVRGYTDKARPAWFERHDVAASSLSLGSRACSVRPGAAVSWLPSACLVARTATLHDLGGFAGDLRVGEDVDLVWRLVRAGHVVRYQPDLEARHEVRGTVPAWLGRKLTYGTGGAELGRRHGSAIAPAVLSPAMAAAGAAILAGRWWSAPAALASLVRGSRAVANVLPDVPGRDALAARLALPGARLVAAPEVGAAAAPLVAAHPGRLPAQPYGTPDGPRRARRRHRRRAPRDQRPAHDPPRPPPGRPRLRRGAVARCGEAPVGAVPDPAPRTAA